MYFVSLLIAAHVARFAQLRRARPRSATGSLYSWSKPHFSRHPGKNDLANDPFQGRSPLKRVNTPTKTKRALKGLGDPRFSSPIRPYFGKRGEIEALIFTFRNRMALRECPGPETGNRSPIWACFSPPQQYPNQTAISRQKASKKRRVKGVKQG